MGLYRDQVLPRLVDRFLDDEETRRWRERCVAGLHGEVAFVGLDGESLPIETSSCDAALLTLSLCTGSSRAAAA